VSTRRRGNRWLIAAFIFIALVIVVGLLGVGTLVYGRTQLDAPAADHSSQVDIVVTPGESLGQLTDDLNAHHLIKSSFFFSWYARFKGLADKLQAGKFRLDTGMGASAIIAALESSPEPPATAVKLVLAEGLTAAQQAAKIEAAGVGIKAVDYLDEMQHGQFNGAFLASKPAQASVEGFLFPDTYEVPPGTSAHALIQMQLDTFGRKAGPLLASPPGHLTAYQMVVLASIVEREARFDADRPLVAGVLYNRLADNMLLQVDATVMYGVGRPGQQPTVDDLHKDTPYNTYLHTGLPPTPISNPGVATLTAAAQPAQTLYLFYVSDGCGHNHYSTTVEQHNQQAAQYAGKPCAA
jgi:peptidoglycan lytic transglycosylase G